MLQLIKYPLSQNVNMTFGMLESAYNNWLNILSLDC